MKRGSRTSGSRRRHRRVEPLGVADRQNARRARRAPRQQPVGLGGRAASSASRPARGRRARETARRSRAASRSASAIGHRIDRSRDSSRQSVNGARAVLGGDLARRASRLMSTTADELDARQRRQNPRVVPPEVADADDRDPHRPAPGPPTDDDAGLVRRVESSRRRRACSVFPASIDSTVAPAARIASIVGHARRPARRSACPDSAWRP